ncbi:ATP-binding protein [Sporohalobacter salinus]|uniref:ATP-binding protein n=1 Tax=Sporohalobacter salinus TaxID=1494606 RepID=UPI001961DEF7|nr:signal transduction histidine kinase [Sporohalobacter salinus]
MQTVENEVKGLLNKTQKEYGLFTFLVQIFIIFLITKLVTFFSVCSFIQHSTNIVCILNFIFELVVTFISWGLFFILIYTYQKTNGLENLYITFCALIVGTMNLGYIILVFNNPDLMHNYSEILTLGTTLVITAVVFLNWFVKSKEDKDEYYYYLLITIGVLTVSFLVAIFKFRADSNLVQLVFRLRILMILLLTSNIILYTRRFYNQNKKVDLSLVKAFIFFLLGQFFCFNADSIISLNYLAAELYKLAGFFYLFRVVLNSEITNKVFKINDETDSSEDKINTLRAQRHDFKNQLQTIYTMVQMDKPRRIEEYIQDLHFDLDNFNLETNYPVKKNEFDVVPALLTKKEEAERRGIDFNIEVDFALKEVNIPQNRISKIIFNLIDNAFDAVSDLAKEKQSVKVQLIDNGNYGKIIVSNPGPKIPVDKLDIIFQPGYSTKGDKRGFGLHIIKSILEEHGGKIKVESSKRSGTKFICCLPK